MRPTASTSFAVTRAPETGQLSGRARRSVSRFRRPPWQSFSGPGIVGGGRLLERSLSLTRRLEVLALEGDTADDAARLGGDLDRRGLPVGNLDLLIAAIARRHRAILVTRDLHFQRIPGLHLETY